METNFQNNNVSAIETPKIQYELMAAYPADNLLEYRVHLNGVAQQAKHLVTMNNGKMEILAQHSMKYKVVPFSQSLKASDDIATEIGAVPFNEFRGPWFVKAEKHTMFDKKGAQMHALYAFDKPVEIRKGDSIQLGFSIHNSYDKSTSLGGGFFTFRHACENMFFMGLNGRGMSFDTRKVLAYFSASHSKTRTTDDIRGMMRVMTEQGMRIVNAIRKLPNFDLEKAEAVKIFDILPKAEIEKLSWARLEGKEKTPKMLGDVNKYKVWNDVTDYLSHSGINIDTMMWKMKKLDQILVAPLVA